MSYVIRWSTIAGVILFACTPSIQAATSVSPSLTGSWSGSATGTEYKDQDNGTGGTTPVSHKASGNAVASVTQTGNDLIFTLTITSTNSSTPTTFTVPLTGKVGDFAFWATGVEPASDTDPAQQVFASGHFDKKPSKITGNMIFYKDHHVTDVAYTLKKTSSTPMVRDARYAFVLPEAAPRDNNTPFNIAGSSTGKSFDFSTSAKAVSVKSTISGMIDPVAKTATVTNTVGSNAETFNETEIDGGKAFVFTGMSGSDSLLLFGVGTGTGGGGIGWIYNDGGMTEFKWSVKKQ
ncbi:MAG TPA: hypothetical protein VKX17_07750 [Planctomycetota bacterium]|nr:hypothetical protein [Planctomycetota bacterium]